MHIISKQGSADNVLTYEHICDTAADMAAIERRYITLGSVCIVLQGESGAMEVYMADSDKEWHDVIVTGGGSGSGESAPAGLSLYICTSSEVANGKPDVEAPTEGVLYLVPSGNQSGNLYDEYIYVNDAWELFGGASIDLTGYATQAWVSQQGYLTSHQDISGKADKTDTVLETTLSRGRKSNTTAGSASLAFGVDTEASGYYSIALGLNTTASSQGAFAEGKNTVAHYIAHAEGENTQALGQWAHSQGVSTAANGAASFAGGDHTIANGHASFVTGRYNAADSYDNWPTWTANTSYEVGDRVKRNMMVQNQPTDVGYHCTVANSDATFDIDHWELDGYHMNYVEIVGNGKQYEDPETHQMVRAGSNAYALEWDGTAHFAGDVYVGANSDSTGGNKLATETYVIDALATKISKPSTNGTSGQVLTADGNGGASWQSAAIDPTAIENAVSDWLDDHPDATTTVADGSISQVKLNTALSEKIDDVTQLRTDVGAGDSLQTETILYDGYSDTVSGSPNLNSAPFSLDVPTGVITSLKMNVAITGTLHVGYMNKEDRSDVFDETKITYTNTLTLTQTGEQIIELPNPIEITSERCLVLSQFQVDTANWLYHGDGKKGFWYCNTSTRVWSSVGSACLGVGVINTQRTTLIDKVNVIESTAPQLDTREILLHTSYNAENTDAFNMNATPCFIKPLIDGIAITKIHTACATAGVFTIGAYPKDRVVAGHHMIMDDYLMLAQLQCVVGEQTIEFEKPVFVPRGYTLGLGLPTDNGKLIKGAAGKQREIFYTASATGNLTNSTNSLNVDIYGYHYLAEYVPSVFRGKKVSFMGDSISTYKDWIPVNHTYYTGSNSGITSVHDTWWMKTVDALEMDLLVNNSYSGRAVTNVRDTDRYHEDDAGYRESTVIKCQDGDVLPDIIIIKLGVNDFIREAPLGTYDGTTALPTDPTTFTDAYAIMLNHVMTHYPLAKVYCCTIMTEEWNGPIGFPETNENGEHSEDWNEAIRRLAGVFGAEVLDHARCGLTYYNIPTYMGDYDTTAQTGIHPNAAGHSLIANQTIHDMDNAVRIRY